MIKKVTIRNYQSHRFSKITFCKGVNIIVGKSRVGKTALLRAIYWALFNRPTGDSFKSNWGGDTFVKTVFDDFVLKRVKSKKLNGYIVNGDLENPEKGFGINVPENIAKKINMTKINFQQQHDGPFMLNWDSGEVGRFLNEITNLDIIDRTQTKIKKTIREEKNKKEALEYSIKEDKAELKKYDYLDEMEKDVSAYTNMENKNDIIYDKIFNLNSLIRQLEKADKVITRVERCIGIEKEVIQIEKSFKKLGIMKDTITKLIQLISDIEDNQEEIDELRSELSHTVSKFKDKMPKECPLCGEEITK